MGPPQVDDGIGSLGLVGPRAGYRVFERKQEKTNIFLVSIPLFNWNRTQYRRVYNTHPAHQPFSLDPIVIARIKLYKRSSSKIS
jgi:hypothetical protein